MDNEKYQIPEARAMTRAEVKALRTAGLDPVFMDREKKVSPVRVTAELNEWILGNIYKDHSLDQAPQDQLNTLCDVTFRKTYGLPIEAENDETKNS